MSVWVYGRTEVPYHKGVLKAPKRGRERGIVTVVLKGGFQVFVFCFFRWFVCLLPSCSNSIIF